MRRIFAPLRDFWFRAGSPVNLGIIRLLTGLFVFRYLVKHRTALARWSAGDPSLYEPIGVVGFLPEPISPELYESLLQATLVLCGCFVVGVWQRVLAPVFGLLFLFVVSYSNSWGMVYHTENMLVLHVLVLCFSLSAASISADSFLTDSFPLLSRLGFTQVNESKGVAFGWPVRLMQLGATLPYTIAGLAKIRGDSGLSWALGTNLRDQITMNGLYYELYSGKVQDVPYSVYGWDNAFLLAATFTLFLELGAPLALLNERVGYLYVLSIMGMHWSILGLMGIPFPYQLRGFAYACFLPWDRIFSWGFGQLPPPVQSFLTEEPTRSPPS